jgi:glycerophosphoryl diester phosphodiesterase
MPPPLIVAHRGLHHVATENTLAAFTAACVAKIPWVECDVWLSADGIPVVIHDQTLHRTTAGAGRVTDHTLLQLQQLQVPALSNLLATLTGGTGIMIEIKPPAAIELVKAIRQLLEGFRGPWMIQSFHFENVDLTERSAVLVEDAAAMQTAIDGKWKSVHADHAMLDRELVDRLHGQGRKVGAWTVNTPADIHRMIELGVDMMITDEPKLAADIIANSENSF